MCITAHKDGLGKPWILWLDSCLQLLLGFLFISPTEWQTLKHLAITCMWTSFIVLTNWILTNVEGLCAEFSELSHYNYMRQTIQRNRWAKSLVTKGKAAQRWREYVTSTHSHPAKIQNLAMTLTSQIVNQTLPVPGPTNIHRCTETPHWCWLWIR